MPFNGSGTYSLPSGNPVVTNTPISSTVHNATTSDIATALTNCVTRDGQSPPTAPLPMGNQKITGLAKGTVAGDAVRYEQAAKIDESTGANSDIKSLSGLTTPLSVAQGGTGSSTAPTTTGTGSVVLNNSPTLITPVLGTPSSGNLSNCTFPTLNQNTTGSAASATTATSADGLKTASGIVSVSSATAPTTGQVLVATSGTAATWQSLPTGTGTVTSVAMTVPSFLSVTGSPVTSTGTLAVSLSGTALPVANGGTGNTNGTATINANLTGAITSVGNAASLGSFTSANLAAALTDETGTGVAVFANAPTFPAQINLTANSGYNIYASGTADNYLAGRLGVGGGAGSDTSLQILRSLTGATTQWGVYHTGDVQSDVTANMAGFRNLTQTQAASFTLSNYWGFMAAQNTLGAGSAITSQYGFFADNSLTGATNNYGFYGGIASGANRYNLYMVGTADNYLAGNLGVGSINASYKFNLDHSANSNVARFYQSGASLNTDIYIDNVGSASNFLISRRSSGESWFYNSGANPFVFYTNAAERLRIDSSGNVGIGGGAGAGQKLIVGGNLTGAATAYGQWNYLNILSDVTSEAVGFATALGTNASAFTTNISHFKAIQNAIGAGSTVSSQYGFNATSLTGATNNYGFYGAIASGANRYNLYMAGTADNYLAGKLGIGTTNVSSLNLAFPIGQNTLIGQVSSTSHSAGNVGSVQLVINDGGGASGVYVNNTHNGTLSSQDITFLTAEGGVSFATERMKITKSGTVGIGTSSPDANSRLTIGGTPSVSSPNGQLVNATFSSAATGVATGYLAQPSTAAASFTLGTMTGFKAAQGTKGSGSTITLQTGFLADTSLVDGVNNAGFYGNIAAASGRYNFYAGGTAVNAFSGDVNIFGAGKLGYTTGSGGAVTQTGTRTSSVTLNKTNGAITLVSAAGSATYQAFYVFNSTISTNDVVVCSFQQASINNKYAVFTTVDSTGFTVIVSAVSGTTTEAPVINFAVIKAVNA